MRRTMIESEKRSRRFSSLLVSVLLLVVFAGCGGEPAAVSDHTHLWIGDESQNVWSYERATLITAENKDDPSPDAFLKVQISSGQKVLFESGQVVSYDGTNLRVGKKTIKAQHVHVERDGTILENAFIRSRDSE